VSKIAFAHIYFNNKHMRGISVQLMQMFLILYMYTYVFTYLHVHPWIYIYMCIKDQCVKRHLVCNGSYVRQFNHFCSDWYCGLFHRDFIRSHCKRVYMAVWYILSTSLSWLMHVCQATPRPFFFFTHIYITCLHAHPISSHPIALLYLYIYICLHT
jgi:hypothetical protein